MANCKDCIHVEVCRYYTNELAKANGIPLKVEEIEGLLECDDCEHFKDRSRFVELEKCEGSEIITLEDAIVHCYEVADGKTDACEDCKAEHMMLGAWLRELKLRREQEPQKPLAIGDEVWCVLEDLDDLSLEDYKFTVGDNAVSDITQVVTEVGENGFWIDPIGNGFKPEWNDFYRWDEFGETIFLTREEAEQTLKEREENA